MPTADFSLLQGRASVVGSFGSANELRSASAVMVRGACDIVEIRLDQPGTEPCLTRSAWEHLEGLPLLFTARRQDEGGRGDLRAEARAELLHAVLGDAAVIDIEVASLDEMSLLLPTFRDRKIPWIASFHDFVGMPDTSVLEGAARRAKEAGAHAFKAAVLLRSPLDMARLADFQLKDHGLPVATMGMGPLAVVSRLLCAQCGSVLNYGYLGETPTAPGQWDAGSMKWAIARLCRFGVGGG